MVKLDLEKSEEMHSENSSHDWSGAHRQEMQDSDYCARVKSRAAFSREIIIYSGFESVRDSKSWIQNGPL